MTGPADDVIEVRLFAGLEGRTRDRVDHLRAPVAAPLERLGLPPAAGLLLMSGVHARFDQALRPGDDVSLSPPLGGG